MTRKGWYVVKQNNQLLSIYVFISIIMSKQFRWHFNSIFPMINNYMKNIPL